MHLLLWINVMLDFNCMDFAELSGKGTSEKLKMKLYVRNRTSDPSLSNRMLRPLNYSVHINIIILKIAAVYMDAV